MSPGLEPAIGCVRGADTDTDSWTVEWWRRPPRPRRRSTWEAGSAGPSAQWRALMTAGSSGVSVTCSTRSPGLVGEMLGHHAGAQLQLSLGDSEPEIRSLPQALAAADGDTEGNRRALPRRHGAVAARAEPGRRGPRRGGAGRARARRRQAACAGERAPQAWAAQPPGGGGGLSRHPKRPVEMVVRAPGLEAVALIVRLHHERPDGRGLSVRAERRPDPMATGSSQRAARTG